MATVNDKGEVMVEDQYIGKLGGFRFQQDANATPDEARTLRAAGMAALGVEFNLRSDRFYNAPDTEIDFTEQGGLMWGDAAVGKLVKGADILSPEIEVFVDEEAGSEVAAKVRRRLGHFVERKVAALFEALIALQKDEAITGMARGVAFRLVEELGVLSRATVAKDVKELDQDARAMLRKHGVRFGQYTLFLHPMLKPAPTRLRLVLWSLWQGLDEFPESPPPGLVTVPALPGMPDGYFEKAGYRQAGTRAIRIDMLERLADMTRSMDSRAGFEATADMLSITGLTLEQFADLMTGLGYKAEKGTRDKVRATPTAAPLTDEATELTAPPIPDAFDAAPVADADQGAGQAETVEASEALTAAEAETFYVFTWAPKKRPDHARRDKPKPKAAPRRGKKQAEKDKAPPRPERKVEKPIDPDNPFAALMALKKPG